MTTWFLLLPKAMWDVRGSELCVVFFQALIVSLRKSTLLGFI